MNIRVEKLESNRLLVSLVHRHNLPLQLPPFGMA